MGGTRTGNSIKNAKWGVLLQLVTILAGFVTRTVFVRILGIECNGLNGLFTEVIAMLSLAEMGVGSAIVYNLYKPLADNDEETLCRLMGLFKKAYTIIGFAVFIIGLIITPFVHLIVTKTDFEINYIRIVFMLFVTQTASSYFFAYKRSLLNADQKNYAVSLFTLGARIVFTTLNVIVLIVTHNYIAYLVVLILAALILNYSISVYADRQYPFLKHTTQATREERKVVFSNIKNIFISSLSGKITSSTDNILISILVSTYTAGLYANYAFVMSALMNLFRKVSEATRGSFGNLIATESNDRLDLVLKRTTFMFSAIGCVTATGLYSVLTPFVKLWIGENYTIGNATLFVCCLNVFLMIAREPLWNVYQTNGMFSVARNVAVIGSLVNLVVSVILGKIWGMLGIFIGTTCTLVIQIVLKICALYSHKLERSPTGKLFDWSLMSFLTCGGMLFSSYICSLFSISTPIIDIAVKGVISVCVSTLLIVCAFCKSDSFSYTLNTAKHYILRKEKAK